MNACPIKDMTSYLHDLDFVVILLRIEQVLQENQHHYVIRADIRSFYKSILHHKLIDDIKKYYNDPKLISMLENIITNPIDAPRGTKNPIHGVALRGPLSQFFSAIYLKPLEKGFNRISSFKSRMISVRQNRISDFECA